MSNSYAISYINESGAFEERRPLSEMAYLHSYEFPAVREAVSYHGQIHLPGYFWMSRLNRLVAYESRLEMVILMQLDYNPDIKSVLPQPFVLHYTSGAKERLHIPDFFALFHSGIGRLIDVKPQKFLHKARNQIAFSATAEACEQIGWEYSVESEPQDVFLTNLRWLAGFRRPHPAFEFYADHLIDLCTDAPTSIAELIAATGPAHLVRPVMFYMLWCRMLQMDMYKPLTEMTVIDLPNGAHHAL